MFHTVLQFGTFGYMYPFTFSYFHLRNSIYTLSLWGVASIPKSVRGVAWYKRLKTPVLEEHRLIEYLINALYLINISGEHSFSRSADRLVEFLMEINDDMCGII